MERSPGIVAVPAWDGWSAAHPPSGSPSSVAGAFNMGYATKHTVGHPLIEEIRRILDAETAVLAAGGPKPRETNP